MVISKTGQTFLSAGHCAVRIRFCMASSAMEVPADVTNTWQ